MATLRLALNAPERRPQERADADRAKAEFMTSRAPTPPPTRPAAWQTPESIETSCDLDIINEFKRINSHSARSPPDLAKRRAGAYPAARGSDARRGQERWTDAASEARKIPDALAPEEPASLARGYAVDTARPSHARAGSPRTSWRSSKG
jgi:hypothetical protein